MGNAKNDLWFVIGMLILLGFAWFITGGPTRTSGGLFSVPSSGNVSSSSSEGSTQIQTATDVDRKFAAIQSELNRVKSLLAESAVPGEKSPFLGVVSLQPSSRGPEETKPEEEFVELRVDSRATQSVSITGWTLESMVTGNRAKIGQGARLLRAGLVNTERDIVVSPGNRIFITTGRSPIGVSFQTNLCTGYLEQFQDFSPSITQACPAPKDDLTSFGDADANFDSVCVDFVRRTRRCTTPLSGLPIDMGNSCRSFLATELTYNGCFENHKSDEGFFGDEWRIFLGKSSELWKSDREVIRLLDENNKTVDVFSY